MQINKIKKILAVAFMTVSLISIAPISSAYATPEEDAAFIETCTPAKDTIGIPDTYEKNGKYYSYYDGTIKRNTITGKNYAKEDGSLARNEWVYVTYKTADLDGNTKWVSTWRYYGDDFEPLVGMHTIDGKKYILGPNLGMGWFKPPKCVGKGWYYSDPNDGSIKAGWVQDGNDWYYVDDNGRMLRNTYVDGCRLNNNGKWVK